VNVGILYPSIFQKRESPNEDDPIVVDFIRALEKYLSANALYLITTPGIEKTAENVVSEVYSRHTQGNRIQITDLWSLPELAKESDFVLQTFGIIDTKKVMAVRTMLDRDSFPITAAVWPPEFQNMDFYEEIPLLSDARSYDSFICPTLAGKKSIESLLANLHASTLSRPKPSPKVTYIPMGVDTEVFQPYDKLDSRYLLQLPVDKKIILSFGEFSVYENMDLLPLIYAFKEIIDQTQDVLLILAGSDKYGYAEQVINFVKEIVPGNRTLVWDHVDPHAKWLLYSSADIFISPSDSACQTTYSTLIEAMSFGLPVVASDWGSYRNLLKDGETGFKIKTYWADCHTHIQKYFPLVPSYLRHLYIAQTVAIDIKNMVRHLLRLLEDEPLRRSMGEQARKYVIEEHDWRLIVSRYEKLWGKLLQAQAKQMSHTSDPQPSISSQRIRDLYLRGTLKIDQQAMIRRTNEGEMALKTMHFSSYEEMSGRLYYPLMLEILGMADQWTAIDAVISYFQELSQEVSNEVDLTLKQQIVYQIMWLMKQGFIQISSKSSKQ